MKKNVDNGKKDNFSTYHMAGSMISCSYDNRADKYSSTKIHCTSFLNKTKNRSIIKYTNGPTMTNLKAPFVSPPKKSNSR